MPANGRWDLIRRLKVNPRQHARDCTITNNHAGSNVYGSPNHTHLLVIFEVNSEREPTDVGLVSRVTQSAYSVSEFQTT